MNAIKLLMVLALAGFGYQYWSKHHQGTELAASSPSLKSQNGFSTLPALDGLSTDAVLIFAAENCPEEGAQRADNLAEQLVRNGIPVARSQHLNFTLANADSSIAERVLSILNGEVPLVIVNGRAKSNPTLDEVMAEYRAARH